MEKFGHWLNNATTDKYKRIFYVCSYTGCGTLNFVVNLRKQGHYVRICHDRTPPEKLNYIFLDGIEPDNVKEIDTTKLFKFNGIEVPEEHIHRICVIYLYRDPIEAIYSKLTNDKISCILSDDNNPIKLNDVLEQKKDLYKLEEFFNNYTTPNPNRNYQIVCIKYDDMFKKQDKIEKLLNIKPLNLKKREQNHDKPDIHKLDKIYRNLSNKIINMPFLKIV